MKKRITMNSFMLRNISAKRLMTVVAFSFISFWGGFWVGSDSKDNVHENHAVHLKEGTVWTCSMHPQIRRTESGQCPICAMDLIPLENEGDKSGPRTVLMSKRAKTLAKIGTTSVKRKDSIGTEIRLLGRIESNESEIKNVTAWIGGRIDRLHVKVTGETVRAGQIIASLYSPEIFAAHQDLIVAKRQLSRMTGDMESSKIATQRIYEASRNRLRLLGVPKKEVDRLETKTKPTTLTAIRTPYAGTVLERIATEGAYVDTGALLYKIVNLKNVWVQLDAYESDLPNLSLGQEVSIKVEGMANKVFLGKITFIDPTVNTNKRTVRVRVEVRNKDGKLRPGMFVQAEVKSVLEKEVAPPLVIPDTAPLFTGRRAVVFVEDIKAERPTYVARTVRLGLKTGDQYPVIAGLSEGELVVTKGAFTLDADLQIKGGNSMMTGPDDLSKNQVDPIIPLTTKERKNLIPAFEAYLELQKQLAADDFDKAKEAAGNLVRATAKNKIKYPQAATKLWGEYGKQLSDHAADLTQTQNIEEARGVFEKLSNLIIFLLKRLGNPLNTPVRLVFCPMAMGSKGAYWVQKGNIVDNSYYGDAMRTCGEIKNTISTGTYLLIEKNAEPVEAASSGGHHH